MRIFSTVIESGFWLWGNESFWHWLARGLVGAVVSFTIIVGILTPTVQLLRKTIFKKYDPTSSGGVGDFEFEPGVPLHKAISKILKK